MTWTTNEVEARSKRRLRVIVGRELNPSELIALRAVYQSGLTYHELHPLFTQLSSEIRTGALSLVGLDVIIRFIDLLNQNLDISPPLVIDETTEEDTEYKGIDYLDQAA